MREQTRYPAVIQEQPASRGAAVASLALMRTAPFRQA
jgi:hypothetical protein